MIVCRKLVEGVGFKILGRPSGVKMPDAKGNFILIVMVGFLIA